MLPFLLYFLFKNILKLLNGGMYTQYIFTHTLSHTHTHTHMAKSFTSVPVNCTVCFPVRLSEAPVLCLQWSYCTDLALVHLKSWTQQWSQELYSIS